jgi:hypothetical protein
MRLHLQLAGEFLHRLTAQQLQHRVGLLPRRPARLRPILLPTALLVVVVILMRAIFTPAYPVSNPTGSDGVPPLVGPVVDPLVPTKEPQEPTTVTPAQIIYQRRVRVLDRAGHTSVTEACRDFGISRTT